MMNWRRFFFENYRAKIALFLMAIFLWFFVISGREYDQVLSVPLRIVNLKENKVFLQKPPSHAEVLFHGSGSSLLLLSLFGDVHLTMDIGTINQYYDFPLRLDHVKWASGVNVKPTEILYPDTVHIRLDDLMERFLRVKPLLTVKPTAGFAVVGQAHSDPESVSVRGPGSVLQDLKSINTQSKVVENVSSPVTTKLDLVPPEGNEIYLNPATVRAAVAVERIGEKEIASLPVQVLNPPRGKQGISQPPLVSIKVRGAQSLLDNLSEDSVSVYVNAGGGSAEDGSFIPQVKLPPGIELVFCRPARLNVTFMKSGG